MQLIIGGRAQGKLEYVCQLSGLTKDVAADHVLDQNKAIVHHFELYIRDELIKQEKSAADLQISEAGTDTGQKQSTEQNQLTDQELTAQIIEAVAQWSKNHPDSYIICDEVGSGIVPMDKFERRYRELTGRTLCELVKSSSKVHRVFSGIGVVIKDA